MRSLRRSCTLLVCSCSILGAAAVQDPSTVPADLKFTRNISTKFHIVAWIALQPHDGSLEKFKYDRYPSNGLHLGVERIKRSDGVFARPLGKIWMRSDDWGASGSAVDEKVAAVLDTDANVVASLFRPPTNQDTTQGGTVWRYVGSKPRDSATEYTFEESRQNPKPDVSYPRYTFLKAPGDSDGRLFLCGVTANLRDDAGIIPISVQLTYFIPIPAGSKIQVFDKDTGKEKLNTIIKSDSGFEVTTQTSEPPSAH
jgi:hypothetical protein